MNFPFYKVQILANEIKFAALNNPQGFTYSIKERRVLKPTVDCGYVVGYAATQDSFDNEGLMACIKHAISEAGDMHVGGWAVDGWERGAGLQYDSVKIIEVEGEAVAMAIAEKQQSYFDLKGDSVINTPTTI